MLELNTLSSRRYKVSEERLKICEECEHLEKLLYRCEKCGCFMKGKTLFMDSKCPLGKWDKHTEKKDG